MIHRKSALACLLFVFLLLGFTSRLNDLEAPSSPASEKLLNIPKSLGSWTSQESLGLGLREQQILQLDSYVRRKYRNPDGKQIQVYIGYWKSQSGDYQAAKHSPKTCLPSNGWEILETSERRVEALNANVSSILARFKSSYMLFDYWFFSGNEIYNKEWLALLKIANQKLVNGRSDGGIVELGIVLENSEASTKKEAQAVLESFVTDFKDSFSAE